MQAAMPLQRSRLGWAFQPKGPIFISLVVLVSLLLAVAAAVLIRQYSVSSKEDRETIAFGVSLVGAGIAIYGLLRAADSIRQANFEKLTAASLMFVQRWNSPSYLPLKTDWRKLNEEVEKLSDADRDKLLEAAWKRGAPRSKS